MGSPYKVKNKPSPRPKHIGKAMVFFGIFTLVLTGFFLVHYIPEQASGKGKFQEFSRPTVVVEDLGKTYEDLKRKYPALALKQDRLGRPVATHVMDGAHFVIWFIREGAQKKAFRIKADKPFQKATQDSVLNFFAQSYGRPIDGHCDSKSASKTQHCRYRWWLQDTISMDLYSKDDARDRLVLSTVLTNTYLAAKYHNETKGFVVQ